MQKQKSPEVGWSAATVLAAQPGLGLFSAVCSVLPCSMLVASVVFIWLLTTSFMFHIINSCGLWAQAFLVAQLVKETACNAGDLGSIPGLGRSPGEGKGYPLQHSGLGNSMDCIIHGLPRVGHDRVTFTFTSGLRGQENWRSKNFSLHNQIQVLTFGLSGPSFINHTGQGHSLVG